MAFIGFLFAKFYYSRFCLLNGQDLKSIVLPQKFHSGRIMELSDECNNCTKFQFYTENILSYIPFFVILHHFVSAMICHKSSN